MLDWRVSIYKTQIMWSVREGERQRGRERATMLSFFFVLFKITVPK